jgi:hypothetical protein
MYILVRVSGVLTTTVDRPVAQSPVGLVGLSNYQHHFGKDFDFKPSVSVTHHAELLETGGLFTHAS